jgi:hypothetical protein
MIGKIGEIRACEGRSFTIFYAALNRHTTKGILYVYIKININHFQNHLIINRHNSHLSLLGNASTCRNACSCRCCLRYKVF